ncbi:hypothetical protein SLS60_003952 [Paraconiothyrium brasiliense]|uniref:HCP-like protein n=1 Tax=Paraconiothyrium brasiliense TaxID=300254 RepID=A0ABR3RQ92_9PLEO
MLQFDKLLPCNLKDANQIIDGFLDNQAKNMDPATNVRQLAERYKIRVVHLPMLAIPMFQIPDVNDTERQLPPSQQSTVAASILLACSAAGDLQATLQILYAVYYSSNAYNIPKAAEIARLFTPKDISDCRSMLEQLAEGNDGKPEAKGDANAMTLHAKFLELAGEKQKARYFYDKALERYSTKLYRGYPHPMALPWLTPWTELANFERVSDTPRLEKIVESLRFGALKADDPMAYYKLTTFTTEHSSKWLEYMTKAAASGHPEAMYKLGRFYLEANNHASVFLNSPGFRKALKFLVSWGPNATAKFGIEWLQAAGLGGHKPALMELAQLHEKEGAKEQAKDCLRAVANDSLGDVPDEWSYLVRKARQRLAAL